MEHGYAVQFVHAEIHCSAYCMSGVFSAMLELNL
jgi:hypothetical protein